MSFEIDRYEFLSRVSEESILSYFTAEKIALKILKSTTTIQRLNEEICSVEVSEEEEARRDKRLEHAEKRVEALAESLGEGWGVILQGDPRGACVKLTMPSGYCDDWPGNTGFCVPTRRI